MYINSLVARNSAVFSRIYAHSFNQQLCAGTLSSDIFKFYLEQDALYLRDFSKALKILSTRFTNPHYALQFSQLSAYILSTELNLHFKYLGSVQHGAFFSARTRVEIPKSPIISHYTEHLLSTAKNAPVPVAVASCNPCFWIYKELGDQMNGHCQQNNLFHKWIASYSSKQFISSTQSITQTANEICNQVTCPMIHKQIRASFLQSAKFELMFFDYVWAENKKQQTSMALS